MMHSILTQREVRIFRRSVYNHYRRNERKLPWRKTRNPYYILVSEIMLQQTQVSRVQKKYKEFLRQFPSIHSLARASLQDVLRAWQGLGYNRRALALKKLAGIIVREHKGKIPRSEKALSALPGIGEATAGAILAYAFNKPVIFIETNIRSVFIHTFFKNKRNVKDREIFLFITRTLDAKNPREWYWALTDYGVMLKQNYGNPNRKSAHHVKQTPFKGSFRELRGKVLKLIIGRTGIKEKEVIKGSGRSKRLVLEVLEALKQEGLIKKRGGSFSIA